MIAIGSFDSPCFAHNHLGSARNKIDLLAFSSFPRCLQSARSSFCSCSIPFAAFAFSSLHAQSTRDNRNQLALLALGSPGFVSNPRCPCNWFTSTYLRCYWCYWCYCGTRNRLAPLAFSSVTLAIGLFQLALLRTQSAPVAFSSFQPRLHSARGSLCSRSRHSHSARVSLVSARLTGVQLVSAPLTSLLEIDSLRSRSL